MSTWQEYHLITDEFARAAHIRDVEKVRHADVVVIPVFGKCESVTYPLDEFTSVSLATVDEQTRYLHTTYTHPDHRGEGRLRELMDFVYRISAVSGWTLLTHPADPWLASRLERNGWEPRTDLPSFRHRFPGHTEDTLLYSRIPTPQEFSE